MSLEAFQVHNSVDISLSKEAYGSIEHQLQVGSEKQQTVWLWMSTGILLIIDTATGQLVKKRKHATHSIIYSKNIVKESIAIAITDSGTVEAWETSKFRLWKTFSLDESSAPLLTALKLPSIGKYKTIVDSTDTYAKFNPALAPEESPKCTFLLGTSLGYVLEFMMFFPRKHAKDSLPRCVASHRWALATGKCFTAVVLAITASDQDTYWFASQDGFINQVCCSAQSLALSSQWLCRSS